MSLHPSILSQPTNAKVLFALCAPKVEPDSEEGASIISLLGEWDECVLGEQYDRLPNISQRLNALGFDLNKA